MSDLLFEDKGITNSVGTWSGDSNFNITVDGTGTLLECKSGQTWATRIPSPNATFNVGHDNNLGADVGFGISLNIMDISNAYIKFTNVGGEKRIKLSQTGKHVVTISPTGIYVDGTLQENTTPTSNTSQISIQLQNTNDYIKYHDLQIYKISEKRFHYANTLHNVRFYDKEDITGVVNNSNKPGLLKDKSSIRINVNQIDDFPSSMTPTSHTHGHINNLGVIPNALSKNVVTDDHGKITTENKPTIPEPNTFASALRQNGIADAGTNNNYARADHVHPQDQNLITSISNKANEIHSHGNIDNNGILKINGNPQSEMNVITDENGKITVSRVSNIPIANDDSSKITMNGNSANAGSDYSYARADHIHPRDSTLITSINGKSNSDHGHGLINQNGVISGQANKNVVTNGQGSITTENKPDIPQANTIASNITQNGAVASAGVLNTFAKADHVHPSDSTKANVNHSHGNININGIIAGDTNKNKNVVTNNEGKIITEDKVDYSDDITEIKGNINDLFTWVNLNGDEYGNTVIQSNSNISVCLLNRALGLCYIKMDHPGTTKNEWKSTGFTLPLSLAPIWTTFLRTRHLNQLVKVMDDEDSKYPRRIMYYNKGDNIIEAEGFFFVSGKTRII